PAPPRRSRGGLPGRSTTGRRASVLPPGWPASARGPASFHGALRSGKGHASAARYGGAHPAREDCHPGLGGGAPGRGLGDRRLASLGALDEEDSRKGCIRSDAGERGHRRERLGGKAPQIKGSNDSNDQMIYRELPRFEPPRTARTEWMVSLLMSKSTKPASKSTSHAPSGSTARAVADQ